MIIAVFFNPAPTPSALALVIISDPPFHLIPVL